MNNFCCFFVYRILNIHNYYNASNDAQKIAPRVVAGSRYVKSISILLSRFKLSLTHKCKKSNKLNYKNMQLIDTILSDIEEEIICMTIVSLEELRK